MNIGNRVKYFNKEDNELYFCRIIDKVGNGYLIYEDKLDMFFLVIEEELERIY